MRSLLYLLGRLLGDVNAAKKWKLGRRLGRRVTGRWLGKLMRKLFGDRLFREAHCLRPN